MKWMSRPSISVVNCRSAFSLASRAPVVLRLPVAGEKRPHRRELHALGLVSDGLLLGPLGGSDAATEILEGFVGNVDVERADLGGTLDRATHANHGFVAVAMRDWVVLTSASRRLGAHRARTSGRRHENPSIPPHPVQIHATIDSLARPWDDVARRSQRLRGRPVGS